jgi:DNA/RNA-binding domain of Phe-tRNA-synthetase-like protein
VKQVLRAFEALLEACEASERDAMRIADQLDAWANDSVKGGWSTQHVEPMRRLAREIRADDKRRCAIEAVRRLGGRL